LSKLSARFTRLVELPFQWFDSLSSIRQDRLVGLVLFLPSAVILGIAMWLTPDPAGMGTHQQLGLGGCAILTISGYPCPMCGMTTTFTHLAHLQFIKGFINQPFGVFLFSGTVVACVLGFLDVIHPKQRWRSVMGWVESHETALAISLLVGMVIGWGYKIAYHGGHLPWSI